MFFSGKIIDVTKLSSDYYKTDIKLFEKVSQPPKPFQFVMLWIPRKDLMPMSVADYHDDILTIIFKVRGEGTKTLAQNPGFVGVNGFYGKGIKDLYERKILFVAGGSGVAPLPYLTRYFRDKISIDVIWGFRYHHQYFDLSNIISSRSVGEIFYVAEDCVDKRFYCGKATDLYQKIIERERDRWDLVIASGPKEMLAKICEINRELDVYVNLENHVKCGLGFCGSCVLKPTSKLLCVDGPLFSCDEVAEYLSQN